MEENKQNDVVKELLDVFEKNKGLVRDFAPFKAVVLENMSIEISSESGWKIVYPAFCETWAFVMTWLDEWSDHDKTTIENFIKGVVFPCSMRLSDVDAQYAKDIIAAHESLTSRKSASKEYEPEE